LKKINNRLTTLVWTQAANCAVGSSGGAYFYASNCNIFKKIFFTLCWRILVLSQLWPLILLRKCVCPSTQAPFGMIHVVSKLGSYSTLQHKKLWYRVEIFAPSILWIPVSATLITCSTWQAHLACELKNVTYKIFNTFWLIILMRIKI